MKFYINKINQPFNTIKPLKEGEYYVGLFSQCETKGEGDFCGYYATEKYLNTYLIGYCIYKGDYLAERVGEVVLINKHFDEICILSHIRTQVIEAPSIKQAIEKFKKSDWRQWLYEQDEIHNNLKTL